MWQNNPSSKDNSSISPNVIQNLNIYGVLEPQRIQYQPLIDLGHANHTVHSNINELERLPVPGSNDLIDLFENIYVTPQSVTKTIAANQNDGVGHNYSKNGKFCTDNCKSSKEEFEEEMKSTRKNEKANKSIGYGEKELEPKLSDLRLTTCNIKILRPPEIDKIQNSRQGCTNEAGANILKMPSISSNSLQSYIGRTSKYDKCSIVKNCTDSTANYDIGSASKYEIGSTSQYGIDSNAKYDIVSNASKYEIGSTSQYGIASTAKYDLSSASKYEIGSTSQYGIASTAKYDISSASKYEIGSTSQYDIVSGASKHETLNKDRPSKSSGTISTKIFSNNNFQSSHIKKESCNSAPLNNAHKQTRTKIKNPSPNFSSIRDILEDLNGLKAPGVKTAPQKRKIDFLRMPVNPGSLLQHTPKPVVKNSKLLEQQKRSRDGSLENKFTKMGPSFEEKSEKLPQIMDHLAEQKRLFELKSNLPKRAILSSVKKTATESNSVKLNERKRSPVTVGKPELPKTKQPVTLNKMGFLEMKSTATPEQPIPLKKVPPVVLDPIVLTENCNRDRLVGYNVRNAFIRTIYENGG